MTLYIIANPQAGRGEANDIVQQVKKLSKNPVTVFWTNHENDEANQVERFCHYYQEADNLLILGGDGTLSKVLFHLPKTIPFAYYPTGSGNDFAKSLRISSLEASLKALEKRNKKNITVYRYHEGLLINSLDVGFASWTVYKANHSSLKRIFNWFKVGKLIYSFFAIQSLFKKCHSLITITDKKGMFLDFEDYFFFSLANNTYFGGGIIIWPTASVCHEQLHCVYAKGETFRERLSVLISLLLRRHEKSAYLHHLSLGNCQLTYSKNNLLEIDGEQKKLSELSLKAEQRWIYY